MEKTTRVSPRTIVLIAAFGLFLALGCSSNPKDESGIDDGESDVDIDDGEYHSSNLNEMVSLLPVETRGILAIDFDSLFSSESSDMVAKMLSGVGSEVSISRLFGLIEQQSLGMDISKTMVSTLLVQTTDPRDGSILISKIRFDSLDQIPGIVSLKDAGSYQDQAIFEEPVSGINAAILPGKIFVSAKADALRSIIDGVQGGTNRAFSGLLGPYLHDVNNGHPMSIIYGLPAMFKKVVTGVTLKRAVALSLWLEFSNTDASGEAVLFMDKATAFASEYNKATKMHDHSKLTVVPATDEKEKGLVVPIQEISLEKTQSEIVDSRHELKMLFDLMEAKDNISGIGSGLTQPWKNFFVEDYPPSIFINWEIPESQVEAFSDAILPKGFEMAKLRILETDEPAFFLVLNAYTADGIVSGVRQEWSVFVKDPVSGKPRFMVIEAMAEGVSMDPVNLLTTGDPVTHVHENEQLVTVAHKKEKGAKEHYFTSRINWPQDNPTVAKSAREFVSANDFIFWGGGVADQGLYSSGVYNRDVDLIPPGEYEIVNDTPWSKYIDPQPKSVYVYQNELDILVAMWANLDAPYLDMSKSRQRLMSTTRNTMTKALMDADVASAFKGKEHAIIGVERENSTPSAFFNYRIDESKISEFETNLGLPDSYHLKKTKILESESQPAFYLTLSVFQNKDAIEGTRAEWRVYVDDGSDSERTVIIDLMTQDTAFEPVSVLNLPSIVEHGLNDGKIKTTLLSSEVDFSASIPLEDGVEVWHTLDWVEASESICYKNGICDKYYVEGGSLTEPMISVDPQSVNLMATIPWSNFIEDIPASVLVRKNRQVLARKPWFNVMP